MGRKNQCAVEKRKCGLGFAVMDEHHAVPKQNLHIGRCQCNGGCAIAERGIPLAQPGVRARVQLEHAHIVPALICRRRKHVQGLCWCTAVDQKSCRRKADREILRELLQQYARTFGRQRVVAHRLRKFALRAQ